MLYDDYEFWIYMLDSSSTYVAEFGDIKPNFPICFLSLVSCC